MIQLIWKYLFEVQLLHEYNLAGNHEDDFFALSENERWERIRSRIENKAYNIWDDLDISPTEYTERLLQRYHLKFIKTKLGFFIGIEVQPGDNGNSEYYPVIPVTEPLELNFMICNTTRSFSSITNIKQRKMLPAIYHFTNYAEIENWEIPVLSMPVEDFIEGKHYEMGEMAMFYNVLKQAVVPTSNGNVENWKTLLSVGHVNEADRNLLPHVFSCSFPMKQVVTDLTFALKSLTGETLKSFNFSNTRPITKVQLDFTTSDLDNAGTIRDDFYDLEIIINGAIRQMKRIFLSSSFYNNCSLGIISVNTGTGSPLFRIFKPNGALDLTRDNYNNTQHPLFEIRFKSRLSYWCYYSRRNKGLFPTDQTNKYLIKVGDHLQTREPLPLKSAASEFTAYNEALGQDEHIFLPNPYPAAIRIDDNGFIYTHIYTSKIDGLIEEN